MQTSKTEQNLQVVMHVDIKTEMKDINSVDCGA